MEGTLKHLLQVLGHALDQEQEQWMPFIHADCQTLQHREDIVAWITMLNDALGFCSDTTFLAVNIFDRFLHRVRAHIKYLKCIALTCLYLAAKINEEDEVIPTVSEFVRKTGCRYSVAELKRMEMCILSKLNFNLKPTSSVLEFLYLFDSLVMAKCPEFTAAAPRDRAQLVYKHSALICASDSGLLKFPPSTVALTVFSMYMKRVWVHWVQTIATLQAFAAKPNEAMSQCLHLMSESCVLRNVERVLQLSITARRTSSLRHSLMIKPLHLLAEPSSAQEMEFPRFSPPPLPPAKRRKIRQEVDDTAYDDIRRLYDCGSVEISGLVASCWGLAVVPSAAVLSVPISAI